MSFQLKISLMCDDVQFYVVVVTFQFISDRLTKVVNSKRPGSSNSS